MNFPCAKIAIILILAFAWPVQCAAYLVQGIVKDAVTDTALPRASVSLPGSGKAVVADESGLFAISVPDGARSIKVSCLGYQSKTVPLKRSSHNMYAVYLSPAATQLDEVIVRRGKYSKRNNPAVDFMRRVKEGGEATDPARHPYYSYDRYSRTTLALNNFSTDESNAMMRQFPFLAEHADTSDVTGKQVLGISVKELKSRVVYRAVPRAEKEIVEATRTAGVDELIDPEALRVFLDDVMREVDLYSDNITLLQSRFVSPLSRLAPDFYRFYLTDTVSLPGLDGRFAVLSFYPRNKASFGFIGHLYVGLEDSTATVRRVEMKLPAETAVNFVDNLYITQTFDKAPDGSRLKTLDDLTMELSALGNGKGSLYARRKTVFGSHSFEAVPDSILDFEGAQQILPGAGSRDSVYWAHTRLSVMPAGESRAQLLMGRLRAKPFIRIAEQVLRIAFTGYISTHPTRSKFDFGPVNTLVSFNTLEGTRFRVGGMTTANLSKRFFGRFYTAWGLRDHRWKYLAEAEYSFIDKEYHSRQFPVRSLRLTSSYDVLRPGVNYLYTSPDNIVLSLRRCKDDHALYERLNRLQFIWETATHLSFNASVANRRYESSRTLALATADGHPMEHFTQSEASLTIRYAPGEKFIQGRLHRIPVNMDAPAIALRHTCSPGGFLGSRYTINRTDLDIQGRIWLSAWGYVQLGAGAAHVWSRAPYTSLLIPDVNISYTVQPRSFALLNPMEFISSTAASWDVTYHARGALLSHIPWVRRANLREVVGWRGYWGRLDDKDIPSAGNGLPEFPQGAGIISPDHTPYMEVSAGLENIFRILRLEYVWRLNYRDTPYPIDRSGIRVALDVRF